jgi:glucose/arabinose dehydrogenase
VSRTGWRSNGPTGSRGRAGNNREEDDDKDDDGDPPRGLGRLREVAEGPDGALYVTTSNCDGRGDCPADKDRIVRILK